jgi:hypothetical protein
MKLLRYAPGYGMQGRREYWSRVASPAFCVSALFAILPAGSTTGNPKKLSTNTLQWCLRIGGIEAKQPPDPSRAQRKPPRKKELP